MILDKIIKKAWSDPNYKKEFLKNPEQVLKREGCDIGARGKLFAHEATENEMHFVLPLDDELEESTDREDMYFGLIKKANSDPKFKKEFIKNPKTVLKNAGIDIGKNENVKVIVHENTNSETHIVLPPETELSDAEIAEISGGRNASERCWCQSCRDSDKIDQICREGGYESVHMGKQM